MSGSADKTIVQKGVNLEAVRGAATFEQLQLVGTDQLFREAKTETCKNKVFSMGIAERAQYMVSGHERQINLWVLPSLSKVWGTNSSDPQEVQLRTYLDPTASIVVS